MNNVRFEATPNPQSLRFTTGTVLTTKPMEFASSLEAKRSPLARKLFGFPWMQSLYIGADFVTVTKQEWVDWETLAEPLADLIGEHLASGEKVINEEAFEVSNSNSSVTSEDSATVQMIKKILDEEIRPAVALDGGDITFVKYADQIVYLQMQGACSSCPSSIMTLKEGVENRLKNALPEIKEVLAI